MARRNRVAEVSPGIFDYITTYIPTTRRAYFYRARAVLTASGRDLLKCEECGYAGNQTHIHHLDCNIKNSISTNLMVLCRKCHKEKHPERLRFNYEDIYSDYSSSVNKCNS